MKIGEAAAPPAVVAAAPSTPIAQPTPLASVAQPSPAPAAQAAKLPDLKIGEAAAPPAVVAAAPSTPIAQQTPAPAAQAAKAPDLKTAATAAPPAVVVAAQAAKPADPAPGGPAAQAPRRSPTNETLAYAALLAQGVRGPVEVRLADRATMWLPANRVYLDGEQARKLLGAGKNWDNATQGVVLPATSRPDWMAYVSLVDDGYISDQDAKAMDPEAVLGTYKAKVAAENPARARQGLSQLEVTGWMEAPRYDAKHRLSSCLGATVLGSKSADDRIVNCSSFALGDQGALKIVVAGQETNYQRFRGESGALIDTIVYDKGKGYDDADLATVKTAPYGLIALMTGDTNFKKVTVANLAQPAAPAQKLGLIALLIVYALKFGKMLLFGVAAVFAFVRWIGAQAQVRRQKAGEGTRGRRADLAARHSGGASQARVARRARPAGRRFSRRRRAGTGRGAAKDRRRRGARRRAREIAVAPVPAKGLGAGRGLERRAARRGVARDFLGQTGVDDAQEGAGGSGSSRSVAPRKTPVLRRRDRRRGQEERVGGRSPAAGRRADGRAKACRGGPRAGASGRARARTLARAFARARARALRADRAGRRGGGLHRDLRARILARGERLTTVSI